MCYAKSAAFIEFLMDFNIYDDILDTIDYMIIDKNLLHFELSKLGEILCVDMTGFLRPGHIFNFHWLLSKSSEERCWKQAKLRICSLRF